MAKAPVGYPMASKAADIQAHLLNRPRWELVVRGLIIMGFGTMALVHTGLTIAVLVNLFGAFVFIEGIFQMVGSLAVKAENPQWALMFISGLCNLMIGVIVLAWPGMSALALLWFIAAWALVTGTVQLVFGLRAPGGGAEKALHIVGGIIGIVFGLLAFTWPGATAMAIVWMVGLFAILFSIQLIGLGLLGRGEDPLASPST